LSVCPLAAYADYQETTIRRNDEWLKVLSFAENPMAEITDIVNGIAAIKNANNITRKAIKGSKLEYGDLIYPSKGAIVTIQCSDHQKRQVRSMRGLGNICPDIVGIRGNMGHSRPNFLVPTEEIKGSSDSRSINPLNYLQQMLNP
jgi:hypothetical protein